MVFVRYVQKEKTKFELKEEFLFGESLQTTVAATNVINLIKDFFEKHGIPSEKIEYVCTEVHRLFCKLEFVHLKNVNPKLIIIQCILHRYASMIKTLPDNLKEVIDSVVHIVYFIRGRPANYRLLKYLCEEMGVEHTVLLYHTNVRWLGCGKMLNRLFRLRCELLAFLKNKLKAS